MGIRHFVAILASCCLLGCFAAGCTEQMRTDLDQLATGTAAAAHSVREAVKSPAGDLVPEPARSAVLAGAAALEALALAWLNSRKKAAEKQSAGAQDERAIVQVELDNHRDALSNIVTAIEGLPEAMQDQIKPMIAKKMVASCAQNQVIDQVKAAEA